MPIPIGLAQETDTFLSHALEQSGDLHGVAELAQHSTLQMTKRYYAAGGQCQGQSRY